MKKRILSILLMCCMVLTLLPVTALAEDSAYTVGEDTGVSARALAGTAGTKLKADNIATYIANGLGGGVYTLAEDVTISGTLRVTGDATVDLNGHVLRFDQSAQPDSIFRVTSGSTLTLDDSDPAAAHTDAALPAGGLITGGKGFKYDNGAGQSYNYYGGGVYVETGASFVLAGGTIYACGVQSGANQAFGGGIYAEGGSVTMTGGAIPELRCLSRLQCQRRRDLCQGRLRHHDQRRHQRLLCHVRRRHLGIRVYRPDHRRPHRKLQGKRTRRRPVCQRPHKRPGVCSGRCDLRLRGETRRRRGPDRLC